MKHKDYRLSDNWHGGDDSTTVYQYPVSVVIINFYISHNKPPGSVIEQKN